MKHIVLLLSYIFLPALTQANIFQCVDPETGETVFKDKECEGTEVLEKTIELKSDSKKVTITPSRSDNSNPLGKNLLRNASFENKLIDWRHPIGALWSKTQGVSNSGGLSIQAEIPPEDKYIHETVVSQCVILGEGEKFQLKAQFKAEKVYSGKYAEKAKFANRANVIWYESLDCTSGGQYGGYIEPKNIHGWQSLSGGHLKPAFKAKAAKITIVQRGRYARGYNGYWDNIAFVASEVFEQSNKQNIKPNSKYTLPLNENYLKNGDFNTDITSWRGWKAKWSYVGNKAPGSSRVTFESKKGGFGTGAMSQCVNIGENTKFAFGTSVKIDETSTQKGGGVIRISWNDKENCSGRSKAGRTRVKIKDIQGWQHLKSDYLIAPSGTHSVHLELIQTIAGSGEFSVFWDDVYFNAVR